MTVYMVVHDNSQINGFPEELNICHYVFGFNNSFSFNFSLVPASPFPFITTLKHSSSECLRKNPGTAPDIAERHKQKAVNVKNIDGNGFMIISITYSQVFS